MKLLLLNLSIAIFATLSLLAEDLPVETKEAVVQMNSYLKEEAQNYAKRKQKIFDYYIKALKEQKERATSSGNKQAAIAITKELIKLMELSENNASPTSPIASSGGVTQLQAPPKIDSSTPFSEVADYFETYKSKVTILTVDISEVSEPLKIDGSCIVAPVAEGKWKVFRGKVSPVGYKGMLSSNRNFRGYPPGALGYTINGGEWTPLNAVQVLNVKGSIHFSSNITDVNKLKGKSNGSIRVRILPIN